MPTLDKKRPAQAPLRVLSINVHVGLVIIAGGMRWVFARFPGLHIVLVQEASRPRARRALLKAFPEKRWYRIGPGSQEQDPLVGTWVLARKSRFKKLGEVNREISEGLPPDARGRYMYPQRNLNSARLWDRKTGRVIDATSVHTWHMVGRRINDDSHVSGQHRHQIRTTSLYHGQAHDPGSVQIAGGDFNENISKVTGQNSAMHLMFKYARMVPTWCHRKGSPPPRLDEIFFRPAAHVTVARRARVYLPFRVADHPVIYVKFFIRVR